MADSFSPFIRQGFSVFFFLRKKTSFEYLRSYRAQQQNKNLIERDSPARDPGRCILQCHGPVENPWRRDVSSVLLFLTFFLDFHLKCALFVLYIKIHFFFFFVLYCILSVHLRLLRSLGHSAHLPSEMLLAPAGNNVLYMSLSIY